MTMPNIRCENKDEHGNYHIMEYRDFGYKHGDNGYYCKVCSYIERDRDWMDQDDMLESQERRIVKNEYR